MEIKQLVLSVIGIIVSIVFILCTYISFRSVQTLDGINSRLDRANVEYQFVVTDDSLTVFDKNRVVGTVKLQGQLKYLLIQDNQ